MDERENIYDKIKEYFGNSVGNLNILEEQIDIETQMEYFECSRKNKKNLIANEIIQDSDNLFKDDIILNWKKELLVKLASIEEVKAFRILEKYHTERSEELKDWTVLALQESKMLLESKIMDENQIFISTGLGGKGYKLRYFVVIIASQTHEFSSLHKKIIKQEFDYTLKQFNSEVEDFDFDKDIGTIMAVVPMDQPVKAVFEKAINECNTYGDFINPDFVITNVKKLSFEEINDFLNDQSNR